MARTLYHDQLPAARLKSGAAYTCPAKRCFSIQPIVRCPHTLAGPVRGSSSSLSASGDAAVDAAVERMAERLARILAAPPAPAPRPWVDRGQGLPMFSAAPLWPGARRT